MQPPSLNTPATSNGSRIPGDAKTRLGAGMAWLALGLGLVCGAVALGVALGYRTGVVGLGALVKGIQISTIGAVAGAVLALLALVLLAWAGQAGARRKALVVAGVALVLSALVVAPPLSLVAQARGLPLIHDISTDTRHPPQFHAIVPLRSSASNSLDYNPANAAKQQRGYPDLAPLLLPATAPAQAFAQAERAARALGWSIASAAPQEGRLEATDRTPLMGFQDDIVVRIRAGNGGRGSVVDVRSASRVGLSDVGTNARRIRTFLQALQAQAQP